MDEPYNTGGGIVIVDLLAPALERADLDSHLACLALDRLFVDLDHTDLAGRIRALRDLSLPTSLASPRPHDVALLGARIGLGWVHPEMESFSQLCQRELRRTPLDVVDTASTDPRLLLGLCAGAAQLPAEHPVTASLVHAARSFQQARDCSVWQSVLACWSQWYLLSSDDYAQVSHELALHLLRTRLYRSRDRLALLWVLAVRRDLLPNLSTAQERELQGLAWDTLQTLARDDRYLNDLDALDLAFAYVGSVRGALPWSDGQYPFKAVLQCLAVFDRAAVYLSERRRKSKQPFTIEDEYDVQDLLYAMLLPILPDLEPENPTVKNAGTSKRVDFTSRTAQMCIEVKHIASSAHAREVADELRVDIHSYHVHPDCRHLLCFMYDPQRLLTDAPIIERDLSGEHWFDGKRVLVTVRVEPGARAT